MIRLPASRPGTASRPRAASQPRTSSRNSAKHAKAAAGETISGSLNSRGRAGRAAAPTGPAALGVGSPASAAPRAAAGGPDAIAATYQEQKTAAGGTWHTHIAGVDSTGAIQPIVEDDADHVTQGYSVQKLAV